MRKNRIIIRIELKFTNPNFMLSIFNINKNNNNNTKTTNDNKDICGGIRWINCRPNYTKIKMTLTFHFIGYIYQFHMTSF